METNYTENSLLSIILLWTVLSESNGPELKTRFLLLWLKPSCRILPMSSILETHLNDNDTAVLTVFQLIFIWQWESIVRFDCNAVTHCSGSPVPVYSNFIFSMTWNAVTHQSAARKQQETRQVNWEFFMLEMLGLKL